MEIHRRYRFVLFACVAALASASAVARPILEADPAAAPRAPQLGAADSFGLRAPDAPPTLRDDALSLDAAHALDRAAPLESAEAHARPADADARLIADMLDAPRPNPTDPGARPRLDETSPHTLLHDDAALKQRLREIRDGLSPLFDPKVLEGESEDERELRLRREIAMKDSEIRRSVTVGLTSSAPAAAAAVHRNGEPPDGAERAQLRIAQMLLLMWDIATHPISITLILLYGCVRGVAAMLRMAPKRRRRHRSRKKAARTAPPGVAPEPATAREMAPTTPRAKRRHRRRRRSFLDRLRSV